MHLNRSGQSQLLSVIVLGNVMLAMLLGVMEYANQVRQVAIKESRTTEMRKALDASHRMLMQLYHEGVCDPVALNNKINYLNANGQQTSTIGSRQVTFVINGRSYLVSIGPVSRIPWAIMDDPSLPTAGFDAMGMGLGEDLVGVSQDATVEVWTNFGGTRVTQKATLLNNCSYACAYEYGGVLNAKMGICALRTDPIAGYHIVDPNNAVYSPDTAAGNYNPTVASLPQTYTNESADPFSEKGTYFPGNVSIAMSGTNCNNEADEPVSDPTRIDFTGSSRLDVRDLTVFRDYLRSGNTQKIFDSTGAFVCDNSARFADSDLNADGIVNENDLILFEKYLRGYVYQIPVVKNSSF